VPMMPYMDKACDTLPGMKHRCTAAALRYLRAEVMEMCQREGLYQIDLLNGSKSRITEREYWAQKQGQKKLDEENAELIASGEEPRQTKFETDKAILRKQIRAALKKSKTLDEFFDMLLEDYGIAVKESRGRFSYLTPERTKPITSRKLGDDFSKEAILAVLENHAKQIIPSVHQRPDIFATPATKPEIEKLIDLEAKRAEGKGSGYIHWGKTFNLKTMAKTLIYLQENGLTDLDALDAALEDAHKRVTTSRTSIAASADRASTLSTI
nr:relaxase [Oscillospiraceae bacterium]